MELENNMINHNLSFLNFEWCNLGPEFYPNRVLSNQPCPSVVRRWSLCCLFVCHSISGIAHCSLVFSNFHTKLGHHMVIKVIESDFRKEIFEGTNVSQNSLFEGIFALICGSSYWNFHIWANLTPFENYMSEKNLVVTVH